MAKREIKYRAYHKKLKKMFNVHSLLWSGDRLCWAVLSDEKGFLYNDGEEVEIEYLEILQFISLCDKKEKEGYHKDICRIPAEVTGSPRDVIAVIEWDEGCFYFRIPTKRGDKYSSIINLPYAEIIGNEPENPELLEQKP